MNDRELLELAAKAAGRKLVWMGEGSYVPDGLGLKRFDPLTDDGDALRLAVKLNLMVDVEPPPISKTTTVQEGLTIKEAHGDDVYAATRRAIVRAAASIGERL